MLDMEVIKFMIDDSDDYVEDVALKMIKESAAYLRIRGAKITDEQIKKAAETFASNIMEEAQNNNWCPNCLSENLITRYVTQREEIWGAMQSWEEPDGFTCGGCGYTE